MPPAKDGLALVLRVRNWLRVMKTNLLYAKTFVQEISFDEFLSNIEKQYSTARAIEVAGEVSKKIPRTIRSKYSSVPWREIAGMRDILIHAFDKIDLQIVWQVANKHSIDVARELSQLISELGGVAVERKELPVDWALTEIKDAARIMMGQAPPSSSYNQEGEGLPLLQGGAEFREIHPQPRKWTTAAKRTAPPGSVIITVRAPVGTVNIAEKEYAIGRGVAALIPKGNVNHTFLYFLLRFEAARLNSEASGSIFKSINKSQLASFIIFLPPLPEQRAIAYVLRTVQRSKEATEQAIAALKKLKKSLMRHLFTYGPVPVDQTDRVEMQETEIGPLPKHWRVMRLGDVAALRKETVHPSENPNARYVGLEHLAPGEIQIKRFSSAKDARSTKAVFNKGDVLYGKLRPYLDKAALAEWPGICSTDILVLQPKVPPLFLVYLMHASFVLNHAIATTTGVNHPRTSWKVLSQAIVPLPPLPEQREIARILQTVDRKINAEENRKEALEALFKSLLYHLMTAKKRVSAKLISRNQLQGGAEV